MLAAATTQSTHLLAGFMQGTGIWRLTSLWGMMTLIRGWHLSHMPLAEDWVMGESNAVSSATISSRELLFLGYIETLKVETNQRNAKLLANHRIKVPIIIVLNSPSNVKYFHFSADSTFHPVHFCKKKFHLDNTQFCYEFLKTFKFAVILVHHLHQSSSVWSELWRRFRNTWFKSWPFWLINKWKFCFRVCI